MTPAFIIVEEKWNGDSTRQTIVGVCHDRTLAEMYIIQLKALKVDGWAPKYYISETVFLTNHEQVHNSR